MDAAEIHFKCPMRYAVAYETFPLSRDVHTHVAIAADVTLDLAFFEAWLPPKTLCKVLPYKDALPYMMKQVNVQLVNCDVYLRECRTSRERRRLRRMEQKTVSERADV